MFHNSLSVITQSARDTDMDMDDLLILAIAPHEGMQVDLAQEHQQTNDNVLD